MDLNNTKFIYTIYNILYIFMINENMITENSFWRTHFEQGLSNAQFCCNFNSELSSLFCIKPR